MVTTWPIISNSSVILRRSVSTQRSTKKLELWLVRELTAPLPTLWSLTWPEGGEGVEPRALWEHSISAFSTWTWGFVLLY